MRLLLLAAGRIKEPGIRMAIDEYFDRVRRHYDLEEIELRDAALPQLASAFEKRTPPSVHRVALDAGGTARTSEEFANWLGRSLAQGKGAVAFLIGGPDGLPRPVVEGAHERLSLSKMTFSHRLARLVLAEQLYRATAILHHEPYARI